jgi:hypothetical protein
MSIFSFWDVTLWNLVDNYQHFRGTGFLCLQGKRPERGKKWYGHRDEEPELGLWDQYKQGKHQKEYWSLKGPFLEGTMIYNDLLDYMTSHSRRWQSS